MMFTPRPEHPLLLTVTKLSHIRQSVYDTAGDMVQPQADMLHEQMRLIKKYSRLSGAALDDVIISPHSNAHIFTLNHRSPFDGGKSKIAAFAIGHISQDTPAVITHLNLRAKCGQNHFSSALTKIISHINHTYAAPKVTIDVSRVALGDVHTFMALRPHTTSLSNDDYLGVTLFDHQPTIFDIAEPENPLTSCENLHIQK